MFVLHVLEISRRTNQRKGAAIPNHTEFSEIPGGTISWIASAVPNRTEFSEIPGEQYHGLAPLYPTARNSAKIRGTESKKSPCNACPTGLLKFHSQRIPVHKTHKTECQIPRRAPEHLCAQPVSSRRVCRSPLSVCFPEYRIFS